MWTLVTALLVAPPPLGDFPAVVLPADGADAPPNFSIIALGDPAPTPDQVGLLLAYDGVVQPEAFFAMYGCCALVAEPVTPPPGGAEVTATIASAAGETTVVFTAAGGDDETRPTFSISPQVIDHGPTPDGAAHQLIIGAEITDDRIPALLVAQAPDSATIIGSSANGFILKARIPGSPTGEVCADVFGFDVAMNANIQAQRACVTIAEGEGEGEGGDGEGEGGDSGCCAGTPATSLGLAALALRRRRQVTRR